MKKFMSRLALKMFAAGLCLCTAAAPAMAMSAEFSGLKLHDGGYQKLVPTNHSNGQYDEVLTLGENENSITVNFSEYDGGKNEYYIYVIDMDDYYVTTNQHANSPEVGIGPVTVPKFVISGLKGGHIYGIRLCTARNASTVSGTLSTGYTEPLAADSFDMTPVSAAPVSGYGDGTPFTRHDMAVMTYDLRPEKISDPDVGYYGADIFSDLSGPDADIINELSLYRIFDGVGNGLYDPNAPATGEQFIKTLVVSLGYGEYAQSLGGWPEGYIECGRLLGLSVEGDPSDVLNLNQAKELAEKAMTVPHMQLAHYTVDGGRLFVQNPNVTYANMR